MSGSQSGAGDSKKMSASPMTKAGGHHRRHISPIDSDQELNDQEVAAVLAEEAGTRQYMSPSKQKVATTPGSVTISPLRPFVAMTNIQRGNVKTATPPTLNLSIRQMVAQGELVLLQQEVADGADINKVDEFGFSALLWACANGQLSTVEYLIQHGATMDTVGTQGENALLLACCHGYPDIVKYLLKLGLDVNYTDEKGNSSLMYAAYNNHPVCIKILLTNGADMTSVNEDNLMAMDLAVDKGHKMVQQVIERHMLSLFEGPT